MTKPARLINCFLFNRKLVEIYSAMAKVTVTPKSNAMKLYLPLAAFVLALASCSTAYKTGQTPDDVYFSPARQRDEYVRVEKKDDRRYNNDEAYREDRYLRMKTSYRRYSVLDDCDCYAYNGSNYYGYYNYYRYNNPYYYSPLLITPPSYGGGFYTYGNSYNPYYYNPYYNKPYYTGVVYGNVQPVYNKPRTANLNTYGNNNGTNNSNYSKSRTYTPPSSNSNDNYRSSGTNAGGFLRNTFGSGNNNSSSSSSTPSSSSSSSGSSSSSSGSSSAPVRKF